MKKSLIAFIVLFTQTNSFAMHALAASRAMCMPKPAGLVRPCPQRYSSLSKDAARKQYEETMQQAHEYRVAISLMRKQENEKIKHVALQAEKFKRAYYNRDLNRSLSNCITIDVTDCDHHQYCHCHQEIITELEALQKTMVSLEHCQDSLKKLRLDSAEHWKARNESMHHYHKILEDELKDLFESKNNNQNKN